VQQVNIHDPAGQSTYCHQCDQLLIGRDWYDLIAWNLDADGRRNHCGAALRRRVQGHVRNLGPARANGNGCADRGANTRLS
jgi:pyruvate formate lyase activating enzyme